MAQPPVPAAAYHIPLSEDDSLDSYGRYHNPTWRQLESALAELEGATAALTFGSGMAAITSALRALTKPGATLVVPADGYYQVRRYAVEYLAPQGITVIEAKWRTSSMPRQVLMVLAETPSNPGLDVVDLHALAMTCRGHGATLLVDNTTATPLGSNRCRLAPTLWWPAPQRHRRDTTTFSRDTWRDVTFDQMEAIEQERRIAGPILGAFFEAWMVLRSIATAAFGSSASVRTYRHGVDVAHTSGRAIRAVPAWPTTRRTRSPIGR